MKSQTFPSGIKQQHVLCGLKCQHNCVSQIPVGVGRTFTGVIDLVSNQQTIWKAASREDDGRGFETTPLSQVQDPGLLQEAEEARAALIEQVLQHASKRITIIIIFIMLCYSPKGSEDNMVVKHYAVFLHRSQIWMMNLLNYCSPISVMILMPFPQQK